ncbi:PTS operon transcription antiterminator,Probable licABCH operon regulator,PTS system 2-O-a-mannosyl-D-glycerate specific transporter subunit IIABC,Transcriptional antiterminator,PTS system, fructose subfamily, IIA component,Phosphoenolpyruvate-dependent sugar phosphotransferase system, EIIA 2 [[Clostridium] sordellii]|uniref:BglG family transcription antiterminator n=1 Tax=Paraclostridium sordellii TaxID=1505 RepID=UPI000541E74F|nr:BglG family transcription antiterminator [Paeniclostridium sordellii]CEK35296.1 PTS operon transcription antiterminator,Probable licABCH operon regulator,PTS system 2-O-a-mannosyl-D-glycerate specific transporter subunit IIABC,Transcriptional antiterminator,PTS system, fructose subfamily, IIA component,Phosphoenolpyruvate-dependent sugar phosphotransferase system, EIIA 2 [[Clostridium] sordellii] [Paeniclostridium sordellii]
MEYILNKRQLKIIEILKNSTEPINSKALATDIGCSTKTIQVEVKNINSTLEKVKIDSIRGMGYKLVGDIKSVDKLENNTNYNDMDRISYILKQILTLYKNKTLKLENLADDMYVSLSTIKNDLKEVKDILKDYNLKIISRHKLGISLDGDIEDLKRCILESNIKYKDLSLEGFFTDYVKLNIGNIRLEILNNLQEENIILTDYEFNNIFNYILISLSIEENKDYKSYTKDYITNYQNKFIKENNKENKEKILNSIEKFTKNLKLATSIDLSNDRVFKEYLYRHIKSFCIKKDFGVNNQSIVANEIKLKYPFAFELATIAKTTLEKDLDLEIDENETANIAIHIGGALQRSHENINEKSLKAIIVCASGVGTSMLIKAKLEAKFDKKIEILKVIPSYLIDYVKVLDVDFIIATVPVNIKGIPVINVSPFLDDKEIKIIEKFLDTGKIYYNINLSEIFNKELFFTDLDFDNKFDVINYMSNILLQKDYIDEEMKNSYIDREKIATTEIGNMVAIPHGAKGKVFKNAVAIGILKNPIPWEIGQVRLVVMLCLQKESILNYEDLFSNIYKRIDSIAKVISICESKKYDKFIAMFKN